MKLNYIDEAVLKENIEYCIYQNFELITCNSFGGIKGRNKLQSVGYWYPKLTLYGQSVGWKSIVQKLTKSRFHEPWSVHLHHTMTVDGSRN